MSFVVLLAGAFPSDAFRNPPDSLISLLLSFWIPTVSVGVNLVRSKNVSLEDLCRLVVF